MKKRVLFLLFVASASHAGKFDTTERRDLSKDFKELVHLERALVGGNPDSNQPDSNQNVLSEILCDVYETCKNAQERLKRFKIHQGSLLEKFAADIDNLKSRTIEAECELLKKYLKQINPEALVSSR